MSKLNQNNMVSGQYKIVDSLQALSIRFGSVVLIGGSLYAAYAMLTGSFQATGNFSVDMGLAAVGILLGLFLFKAFTANARGYVVDVEADTLEYPGGGIAADSILSYLSPGYWAQHCKRYSLAISEIREVEAYSETKREMKSDGKVSSKTTYYLDINGEFGAIQFSFMTKGKRDELYSLLIQMNKMGSPILKR